MIVEMRTYTLQPGTLAEVEKRFGAALPNREKHSKLAAFWHSEVGQLNQIIHVWAYDSFEQRAAVRAASQKEEGWPPPIREFVVSQIQRGVPPGAVLAAARAARDRSVVRNPPVYANARFDPRID